MIFYDNHRSLCLPLMLLCEVGEYALSDAHHI